MRRYATQIEDRCDIHQVDPLTHQSDGERASLHSSSGEA